MLRLVQADSQPLKLTPQVQAAVVDKVFPGVNLSGSGSISMSEMSALDGDVDDEAWEYLLQSYDPFNTGGITVNEFLRFTLDMVQEGEPEDVYESLLAPYGVSVEELAAEAPDEMFKDDLCGCTI